jgi:hypothetical protein
MNNTIKPGIRIDAAKDEAGRWQPVFELDGQRYFVELDLDEKLELVAFEEEVA